MSSETISIKPFDIQNMKSSFSCICIGPPRSGKTSFCLNFAYYNRNKYPVAYVCTGNDSAYLQFKKIFGPLFCRNYYSETDHKHLIERKRKCAMENGEKHPDSCIFEIFDDFGDTPKIFKNKCFKGTIKTGSQWWQQATFINLQAMCDFEKQSRKNVTYAVIFRESDITEREKLYKSFGSRCGSLQMFNKLMDEICQNFTALVIDLQVQSNKLEDCIFYYKTDNPDEFTDTGKKGEWRFGCQQFWDWQTERYDQNYTEKIDYED